jgi:hypothetical protein
MQPIVFEKSPLTFEEYKALNWRYLWKTRKLTFLIPLLMGGFLLLNTVGEISRGNQEASPISFIYPLLFPGLLGSLLWFSFTRAFKKNYFNTPALSEGLTYSFSNESVSATGPSLSMEQPWPLTFKKAFHIGKWILLSSSANAAYFLDTEKIASPATLEDFKALMQKKEITLVK